MKLDNLFPTVKPQILVSNCDGVPLACDPITYASARVHPRQEIIFLNSNSFPLIDHMWNGDTYQGAIKKTFKEIRKKLGVPS